MSGQAVRETALALVRAYDANVDALNGNGHDGMPHDTWLHQGALPNGIEIWDTVGDCSACGGAQYGADYAVSTAVVALKLALGEPLRPYERPAEVVPA